MSLIPEKPIVFSPTLAATLGLEEAILLQILQECASHSEHVVSSGFTWTTVSGQRLLDLSPFWNEQDIGRLTASLHEKGLLLVGGGAFTATQDFRFAFNEQTSTGRTAAPSQSAPQPTTKAHSAKPMGNSWQPSEDSLRQLSQLGVTMNLPANRYLSLLPIGAIETYLGIAGIRNISKKFGANGSKQKQQAIEKINSSPLPVSGNPHRMQWISSANRVRSILILSKMRFLNLSFIGEAQVRLQAPGTQNLFSMFVASGSFLMA
jgi:hypothetical protein